MKKLLIIIFFLICSNSIALEKILILKIKFLKKHNLKGKL